MHFIKKDTAILVGCFVFALVFLMPVATHGDEWNLSTRFMVNQATEVPGLVLQPNTRYQIRLLDSPAERRVVQVFNADRTRMLTMFMAVSDERATPTDRTMFTFIETEPGYPLPIKEWFYPGHSDGLEFIYSNKQAREIAQHAIEPIQSASAADLHDLATLRVEANSLGRFEIPASTASTASVTKVTEAPIVETKPSAPAEAENNSEQSNVTNEAAEPAVQQPEPVPAQEPAQIAQNDNSEQAATTEQNTESKNTETNASENKELPRTAGELPLIALIGALCLGGGLGMKVLSSRS
ncbi:MAG TPA: hypothetical protein VGK48_01880 [Terriglobia bacterium]|jgi:hypothetical protein